MHRARQLPLWAVNLRALLRRERSLRWRTQEALRELRSEPSLKYVSAKVWRSTWSAMGRAWVLPSLSVAVVVALQVAELQRAPLAVFHDGRESRELLGLLWQAEAAAVALVLAASLFAFESLTRQRSNLPLVEYANKSRLMQFLMLSASGLIAVPAALFATPAHPAPSAAFAAAFVAMAALALLPAFLTRAMRVVHPDWMQEARLDGIRRAVDERVRKDAFERMGFLQLNEWAKDRAVEVKSRFFVETDNTTESGPPVLLGVPCTGVYDVVYDCTRSWRMDRERLLGLVEELEEIAASLKAELDSDEPSVEVPGQGIWRRGMVVRLAPRVTHLEGVVALLDLTSSRPNEPVSYRDVVERSGLDDVQQRNEHARLSRIARDLFGTKLWPLEAWQASDGVMRYRMPALIAEWWREDAVS